MASKERMDAGTFGRHDPEAAALNVWVEVHGLASFTLPRRIGTVLELGGVAARVCRRPQRRALPGVGGVLQEDRDER